MCKYLILNFGIYLNILASGLKCIQCGEDGKCQNNATETLVDCAENELTCLLTSYHEEQFIYQMKKCYDTGEHLKYVGCLKITSDMPGGVSNFKKASVPN